MIFLIYINIFFTLYFYTKYIIFYEHGWMDWLYLGMNVDFAFKTEYIYIVILYNINNGKYKKPILISM